MDKLEKKVLKLIRYYYIIFFLWMVISTSIQRFKCARLTETELFLKIPNSFFCDWEKCK